MKIVKYLKEDDLVRTVFYHQIDEIRLKEGEYLTFKNPVRVKIPWHRIIEVKEFSGWKSYTQNYFSETRPVENGKDRTKIYLEVIEIIEKIPEFFPPTDRMPWEDLEGQIKENSEHIEEETTIESIVYLAEYFGMLNWTDKGLPTVNHVSENPALPEN